MEVSLKEAETKNEAENRAKNKPIKKPKKEEVVEAPSSRPVEYYLKHRINEKLIEGLVDNNRFNDSPLGARVGKKKGKTYNVLPRGPVYEAILKKKRTKKEDIGGNFEIPCSIGGLKHVNVMPYSRIVEDVLVEIVEHEYPVEFVILDIKEDEKRPFILGTPFLTTAKAVIKFDKGTITLRSGKSKISFHRIPESPSTIEIGEKEMEFDWWRSKNFKNEHPALTKVEGEMDNEREVTLYLMRRSLEVLRKFHCAVTTINSIITRRSRSIDCCHKNYITYDLELGAVVFALKTWRNYLYGTKSVIYADHKSLQRIFDQKELNMRQRRKELVKPRCVRAMAMAIQSGVRGIILAAQSEAFKQKNVLRRRISVTMILRDIVLVAGDEERILLLTIAMFNLSRRSPVVWAEIGESSLIGPELVQETTNKVVLIKEKLKAARDRQKSYADNRRKPLEFEVGDRILERIGLVAYLLRFLEKLSSVHDTFHMSNLKKCLADANLHVPLNEIKIDKTLRFVEEPVEIIDREVRSLKRSKISLVKVHWNSKRGPEYTWAPERRGSRRDRKTIMEV
ncbi:putative reverse transcriptase domain-containing protein [Tanacetum coccineum]